MDQALSENSSAARLKLANEYAELGRTQEAEAVFTEIVALDPACLSARIRLAHLKRQGGDRIASLGILQGSASIAPQHIGVQLEIVDDLRELERFDEAAAILHRLAVQHPRNIPVRISTSRLWRRQDNRIASLAALEAAATIDPNHAGVQLEVANDLSALGRFDDAEAVFERLRCTEPGNARVLIELSRLKRRKGDRLASLELAQAAAEIDPRETALQLELADDLHALGRLDEAEALLGRLKDNDSLNIAQRVRLAHLKRRKGDRVGSLAILDEAAAIEPRHVDVQLERADDLRELGRFSEAEAALLGVIGKHPKNVAALISMSRLSRRRGDRTASLAALDAATAIDPRHPRVHLERADDLRELGRLGDAEAVLQELLEHDPQDAATLVSWSRLKRSKGERADALTALETAARVAPRDVGIQLEYVRELNHHGRFGDAESRLRQLLSDTSSPAVLSALVSHLIASERLEEAHELCGTAAESDPNNAHVFVLLGIIARRRGDRWQALARFEMAFRLNPSSQEALQELASELRELGHLAACRELLGRALHETPTLLVAILEQGQLHRKQGLHHDALETFQRAVELHPHSLAAKIELARELRARGRLAASLELLLSAIRPDPACFAALEQINEHFWSAEDFEASLALCLEWMRLYPHHGVPIARAGRALFELGDDDRAFALLDSAVATTHRGEIEAVKIDGFRRRQAFDAAAASLAEWEASAGLVSAVWTRHVQLAMDRGDDASAERQLARFAPASLADRARISIGRGQIAEARWQTEAAARHFQDGLRLNPNDAGAHSELSRIFLKLLDLDNARVHLKRYIALSAGDSIARGLISRASQTHVGQLLDEFALDQDLLMRLKAVLQSDDQIGGLRQLVQAYPDHTPSAIALLMALRQNGLLDPTTPPGGDLAIPRGIVQFWDSDDTPREIATLMQTWQAHHAGFAYRRFNDETAARFLSQHHADSVNTAFARCREPAQRSDIFRLAYLATNGGIYADADDRCFKPVQSFFPEGTTFVAHQEDCGAIGNNFLAAVPDHPVISAALEHAVAAVNRGDCDFPWLSTGPGLLTRAFADFVARAPDVSWHRNTTILGLGAMKREVGIHCQVRYKKTSKHWSRHMQQREHRKASLARIEREVMNAIVPAAPPAGPLTPAPAPVREPAA